MRRPSGPWVDVYAGGGASPPRGGGAGSIAVVATMKQSVSRVALETAQEPIALMPTQMPVAVALGMMQMPSAFLTGHEPLPVSVRALPQHRVNPLRPVRSTPSSVTWSFT